MKLTSNRVKVLEFYIISFQNPHSIVSGIFNYLSSRLNTYTCVFCLHDIMNAIKESEEAADNNYLKTKTSSIPRFFQISFSIQQNHVYLNLMWKRGKGYFRGLNERPSSVRSDGIQNRTHNACTYTVARNFPGR